MDKQLPAEVIIRIEKEAKKFAFYNYVTEALHPNAKFDKWDSWPEQARVCYYSILHYMTRPDICWPYAESTLPAEYAIKMAQAEQENAELKKSNTILDAASSTLNDQVNEARTLLEKFIYQHEAGLLPDRFIYEEIKIFLDGTK